MALQARVDRAVALEQAALGGLQEQVVWAVALAPAGEETLAQAGWVVGRVAREGVEEQVDSLGLADPVEALAREVVP